MQGIVADIRHALRSLRKRPVLVGVVTFTLALGVGANASVFAILHQVVLRPLPYPEPDRLVAIHLTAEEGPTAAPGVPVGDFLDIARLGRSFDGVAALVRPHLDSRITLQEGPEPERILAGRVTADFFRVLGVEARLGRSFLPEDAEPGAPPVVILSHAAWRQRFGGEPGIIGRSLRIDRRPHRVIGVLPPEFEFELGLEERRFWIPTRWTPELRGNRDVHLLDVIGRLAPGATLESARADLRRIGRRLQARHPETNAGRAFGVGSLHGRMVGDVVPALRLLGLAAALVLLVACVNVSVMLLARADFRREEVAVRMALGATPSRMGRLLLVESLLLGLAGAGPGLLLGLVGADGLTALSPAPIPRLETLDASLPLVGFALLTCLGAGLLAGTAPAIRAIRGRADRLGGARGVIGRRGGRPDFAGLLVGVQAALIIVLLYAATLAARGLAELLRVDPGFEPAGRVSLTFDLPEERYGDVDRIADFVEGVAERLRALPGVREAGTISNLPLNPASWSGALHIRGTETGPAGQEPTVDWEVASPGYFRAARIPLLRGRAFRPEDGSVAPLVTVINETLARRYWPDGDPIGATITGSGPEGPWREVVGVVGDVKQQGLGAETRSQMYVPVRQGFPWPSGELVVWLDRETPGGAQGAVRRAVREVEPAAVLGPAVPLEKRVAGSSARARFHATLLGAFAGIAFVLGLTGIYGVVNHWVARRTREIGVRVALGAAPGTLLGLVMRRGLAPTAVGAALGILGAILAGRLMQGLLYGVGPWDPETLAMAALVLLGGAALAAFLPARKAMRLPPARVLKE